MSIFAKVIAASQDQNGHKLTTLQAAIPTNILAELDTHRVISNSVASTRAIPSLTAIANIRSDGFCPSVWQANQPGMTGKAGDYNASVVSPQTGKRISREELWDEAKELMISYAESLTKAGYHKQIQGRLLTPWMYSSMTLTSTDWTNFFALRIADNAEPHMRMFAEAVYNAISEASANDEYVTLEEGQWHTPWVSKEEKSIFSVDDQLKLSVARSARSSYNNHDGTATEPEKDFKLFDMLRSMYHVSPFEHQGRIAGIAKNRYTANFSWFEQYRQVLFVDDASYAKTFMENWQKPKTRKKSKTSSNQK